jgi:hypothetical protein
MAEEQCNCAPCRMARGGDVLPTAEEADVIPDSRQRQDVLKLAASIAKEWDDGVSINALHCAVQEAQHSGWLPKGRVDLIEHFCTVTHWEPPHHGDKS